MNRAFPAGAATVVLMPVVLARLVSLMSLRSLVVVGFALTVMPCVVAVLFSVLALEELSNASKETAYQVAQISEKRQLLRKRLVDMERRGKQYLVLKEPDSRETYVQTDRQVKQILSELAYYSTDPDFRAQLDAVAKVTDRLLLAVTGIDSPLPETPNVAGRLTGSTPSSGGRSRSSDDMRVALFDQLGPITDDLAQASGRLIDRMVAGLERQTAMVQNRILVQTGILVPASLVLISLFIYLITHPIRQLDRGIRQLGTGNLRDPIEVSGPRDLRYLGQRLEWLRDQLTTLEQGKQHFVRNVSHELKTPLANIHEGATLLADQIVGEINAEQQGIVEIMLTNSNRLEHLISELIHYGSANVRRNGSKLERLDLRDIVRTVIKDLELRLRSKSIVLSEDLHPAVMSGNREQLRLVVDNLLSNAVKYTPERGRIDVGLRQQRGFLQLTVQDDGPGIRPEDRSNVFEPFFRASSGREAGVKGTGLGLAIVRECVASHQGIVDVVDSPSGRSGACFRVRLPVDPYA
jgi:two-component system sensor histidine kinase GlrK